MIDFLVPQWFWMLLTLPALGFWERRGARLKQRSREDLGDFGASPASSSKWRMIALAFLIVALARPRWGRRVEPDPPPGHDVVLLVDVSRSMGAEDVVPNRLEGAVEASRGLLAALGHEPGDRAAVVAFAGRAVVRCPLTENLGAVSDVLGALRPGDIEPGGTDLGAALDGALDAFDDQEHAAGRVVVLFSDGEDHAANWIRAAGRMIDAGVTVHCVAIGDDLHGHAVPSGRPDRTVLHYEGEPVSSRRVDAALAAISEATGGAFVQLGLTSADLGPLYRARIEPVARASRPARRPAPKYERFSSCLAAALACALWAERVRGRARKPRQRTQGDKILVVTFAGLFALLSIGADGALNVDAPANEKSAAQAREKRVESPADLVARGRAAFERRDFQAALRDFERVVALRPAHPVARFDVASALFQLGRFEQAREAYVEARGRARPALRARIDFALGNTALALGQVADAIADYDECIRLAARLPGRELAAIRRDAALNRDFARAQTRESEAESSATREPTPKSTAARKESKEQNRRPYGDRDDTPQGADASRGQPPNARNPQRTAPPGSARGDGGAAGSSHDPRPPSERPKSPEERLDDALQNARDARRRRIDDAPPPSDERGGRKNW